MSKIDKRYADDMPDYDSFGDIDYEEPSICYEGTINKEVLEQDYTLYISGSCDGISTLDKEPMKNKEYHINKLTVDNIVDAQPAEVKLHSTHKRALESKKYRQNHPDKVREYQRNWIKNKRAKTKEIASKK